jgi:hypothetical protein
MGISCPGDKSATISSRAMVRGSSTPSTRSGRNRRWKARMQSQNVVAGRSRR